MRDRAGVYHLLKNPRTHTYPRLSPREYWVWGQFDGVRTVQELIAAYFNANRAFAFGLVVGLVQQLFEKQMLRDLSEFILTTLRREHEHRTPFHKLFNPKHGIFTRQFLIARFDDPIVRLYHAVGWILSTRFVLIVFSSLGFLGSWLYLQSLVDAHFRFTASTLGITIVLLYLAAIIPIVLHELAHALATKYFKREVFRGRLMPYYGLPPHLWAPPTFGSTANGIAPRRFHPYCIWSRAS